VRGNLLGKGPRAGREHSLFSFQREFAREEIFQQAPANRTRTGRRIVMQRRGLFYRYDPIARRKPRPLHLRSLPALPPAPLMRGGFLHQNIPPVRRVCLAQQGSEQRVRVVAPACLAPCVLVVDPRVDDDARLRAVAEEQAEAAEEPGTPPVPVRGSQRVTQRALGRARVARNLALDKINDALEELCLRRNP
jgi:hypothetical protein